MITGPVWNEDILKQESTFPTVLAIGDSWFWYPLNNLANPLHRILNRDKDHVILVRGHNGAEAIEYQSGKIQEQIEWDLDKKKGYGKYIKAVFLSGGGNDLAGRDDLAELLKPDCSGLTTAQSCLRKGQPDGLYDTVTAALLEVVSLVESSIPGTPVFAHGYDYALPNGQGFLGLGQWLQYPMNQCKVPRELHQPLVNLLIDEYWASLQKARAGASTLHLVDGRGVLKPEEWANELHPTARGFNKIAKRWAPVLKAEGVA